MSSRARSKRPGPGPASSRSGSRSEPAPRCRRTPVPNARDRRPVAIAALRSRAAGTAPSGPALKRRLPVRQGHLASGRRSSNAPRSVRPARRAPARERYRGRRHPVPARTSLAKPRRQRMQHSARRQPETNPGSARRWRRRRCCADLTWVPGSRRWSSVSARPLKRPVRSALPFAWRVRPVSHPVALPPLPGPTMAAAARRRFPARSALPQARQVRSSLRSTALLPLPAPNSVPASGRQRRRMSPVPAWQLDVV